MIWWAKLALACQDWASSQTKNLLNKTDKLKTSENMFPEQNNE